MIQRKTLIAGNWKMNLTISESVRLVQAISEGLDKRIGVDVLVAPPFTHLSEVHSALKGRSILLGAQDIYWEPSGAFTGEVSASMVKEVGCTHVILGHSEIRCDFGFQVLDCPGAILRVAAADIGGEFLDALLENRCRGNGLGRRLHALVATLVIR